MLRHVAACGLMGAVAVVAWYLYNPLPEGLEERWRYNLLVSSVRVMSDMSYVGSWLGLGDERVSLRKFLSFIDSMSDSDETEGVNVTDTWFDGVPVRVYVPERAAPWRGGLIYLHGGGFIAGTPKGYDSYSLWLTRKLDLVVVSVEYRLLPENPAPVPLHDCWLAARYLHKHAARWGVRASRIGVAGDSAGGNLAAALALKVRDEWRLRRDAGRDAGGDAGAGLHFRFQVLSYPMLQALTYNLPSYVQNDHHALVVMKRWCMASVALTYVMGFHDYRRNYPFQLNETHLPAYVKKRYGKYVDWRRIPKSLIKADFVPFPYHEVYEGHFERMDIAKHLVNPYNFPLMAEDLTDLPTSYVMTAEFDTLRDDGLLYATRLQDAGVEVVNDYFPKGWHGVVSGLKGFFMFDVSIQAMNNITNFIAKQIA